MVSSDADTATASASEPAVSTLDENDLPEAARILRLAFGTFLAAPDPENFWTDRDYVCGRQRAPHVASFAAKLNGKLVGSSFATNWGSVGFLGPITVHPDLQESGIGRALLDKMMAQFDVWGTRHVGLFTFAHSAKHVALYQKYGFYARFLTAIMSAPVAPRRDLAGWSRFSDLSEAQRNEALRACRNVADTLYPGLDLTEEIRATHVQAVGDTVLLKSDSGIAAFAVCHYGPRSEAGADHCFVKFGAVGRSLGRTGLSSPPRRVRGVCRHSRHAKPVGRCEYGASRGLSVSGRARIRTVIQGVAMHRHNDPGYCRRALHY